MKVFLAIGAFILSELVAIAVFRILRKEYDKKQTDENHGTDYFFGMSAPVFKGILERLTIYIGLLGNFPQILIVFGALKIATRIKSDDNISNDYFLIGNLSSIGIAMVAYYLYIWLQLWAG